MSSIDDLLKSLFDNTQNETDRQFISAARAMFHDSVNHSELSNTTDSLGYSFSDIESFHRTAISWEAASKNLTFQLTGSSIHVLGYPTASIPSSFINPNGNYGNPRLAASKLKEIMVNQVYGILSHSPDDWSIALAQYRDNQSVSVAITSLLVVYGLDLLRTGQPHWVYKQVLTKLINGCYQQAALVKIMQQGRVPGSSNPKLLIKELERWLRKSEYPAQNFY